MSLLPGYHLEDLLARRPSQKTRDLIGERLLELFYFQVLRLHAFHADPHLGNYLFADDGSIGVVDFGCVKRLTPVFVDNMRRLYLYRGSKASPHFQRLLDQRYAMYRTRLRPAARLALTQFSDRFYQKVYPPEIEKDGTPFDFGASPVVKDYLRESTNLMHSKGALPEYLMLARVEVGLYHTLHRLRARVHTSRIVRSFLDETESG